MKKNNQYFLRQMICIFLILAIITGYTPAFALGNSNTNTYKEYFENLPNNELVIQATDGEIKYDEQPISPRASDVKPKFNDDGEIEMTFTSKKASTSITYRTVGWMLHLDDIKGRNPSAGNRIDFTGNAFVETNSEPTPGKPGFVNTTFAVPADAIMKGMGKLKTTLDLEEGETVYLSAIFNTLNAGNYRTGPHHSYSSILNAAGWGSQTKKDLEDYYNVEVKFRSPGAPITTNCHNKPNTPGCGIIPAGEAGGGTGYPLILETRVNGKKVYEQRKGTQMEKVTAPSSKLTPRTDITPHIIL